MQGRQEETFAGITRLSIFGGRHPEETSWRLLGAGVATISCTIANLRGSQTVRLYLQRSPM
jgi:hypothetical protein